MRRTILGCVGLAAMAALVACGSSSGGGDEGVQPFDPGGRIEIISYTDIPGAPDDGTPLVDSEDPGTPPADVEDPGAPPADAQDPGVDTQTPVDNSGQDMSPPEDPGVRDEAPVDPGPPCDVVTSAFGYRDNCDGTVTDTNSGLTWEKSFQWAAGLDEARRLCVQSRTGGLKEWRLPTIDELRTLVVGCPATAPGGGCVVHHAALTCEDHEDATCFNDDCHGCANNLGPVVNPAKPTQHCYMDGTFDWYCHLFWSTSQVRPKAGVRDDKRSWYLTFYDAGIDVPPSMAQVQSSAMRCVRGP